MISIAIDIMHGQNLLLASRIRNDAKRRFWYQWISCDSKYTALLLSKLVWCNIREWRKLRREYICDNDTQVSIKYQFVRCVCDF